MIKAKTNKGEVTVSLYKGYQGKLCVSFELGNGIGFSGWSIGTILSHKGNELLLDGSCDVTVNNLQEVLPAIFDELLKVA